MDFTFLTSRRFWCLILMAITGVLNAESIISPEISNAIITILGGFTAIRTIDKAFGK